MKISILYRDYDDNSINLLEVMSPTNPTHDELMPLFLANKHRIPKPRNDIEIIGALRVNRGSVVWALDPHHTGDRNATS